MSLQLMYLQKKKLSVETYLIVRFFLYLRLKVSHAIESLMCKLR